jgi:hypothetical protein
MSITAYCLVALSHLEVQLESALPFEWVLARGDGVGNIFAEVWVSSQCESNPNLPFVETIPHGLLSNQPNTSSARARARAPDQ